MDTKQSAGPMQVAREWAALLDTLVPPETVEVTDITGAKHRLRANLPAAVETKIMRRLEGVKLPDMSGLGSDLAKGSTDPQAAIGATVDALVKVLGDQAILEVVSDCFAMAHPRALATAEANVRADADASAYLPDGPVSASDLFSLADIVSGIIPFAMRAARRIGTTAASLLPPTT